jgi:hypothetical protein
MLELLNAFQHLNLDALSLTGGAVVAAKYAETCKRVGFKSYAQLSATDRKHIDELVESVKTFAETMKPQLPTLLIYARRLTSSNISSFIRLATKILRKKSTVALIQNYLNIYGDLVRNPRRMKAIGAYLRCLMSNLDSKHKEVMVASIEFGFTLLHVVAQTDLKSKLLDVSKDVRKYILRPLYKDMSKSA